MQLLYLSKCEMFSLFGGQMSLPWHPLMQSLFPSAPHIPSSARLHAGCAIHWRGGSVKGASHRGSEAK